MISKSMTYYARVLAFVGMIYYPAVMCSQPHVNNKQSSKLAEELVHIAYSDYLTLLHRSIADLQIILTCKLENFSDLVETRITDPNTRQTFKNHCLELAEFAVSLEQECRALLQNDELDLKNEKIWEITVATIRLFKAARLGINGDFLKKKSSDKHRVTISDIECSKGLSLLRKKVEAYREKLNKALPGSKSPVEELVEKFKTFGILINVDEVLLSKEQQILLHKISLNQEILTINQIDMMVSMQLIGLTTYQTINRKFIQSLELFYTHVAMNPLFRILGFAAMFGGSWTVSGYLAGSSLGARLGFPTMDALVKEHILRSIGQHIGGYAVDGLIGMVHDSWGSLIEYTARTGRMLGFENVIHRKKSGAKIIKVIPHSTRYNRVKIKNEYDKAIKLFDAMLMTLSESGNIKKEELANQTKAFLVCGEPGAGKTKTVGWLINECARRARKLGYDVYEVVLTPKSIEHNEMEMLIQILRTFKKAIAIINFDELHHSLSGDRTSPAYRNMLNYFQDQTTGTDPFISVATTNQKEIIGDMIRPQRMEKIILELPTIDTRKAFLTDCFKLDLETKYAETNINRFATLTAGGNMSRLESICSALKAERSKSTLKGHHSLEPLPVEVVENTILAAIHGLKIEAAPPSQDDKNARAAHLAGKVFISLNFLSSEKDKKSFEDGYSVAIANIQNFESQSKDSLIKPDNVVPGKLIFVSSELQRTEEDEIKIAVAGYIAQSILEKDPRQHNFELKNKDRQDALRLCEAYVQKYQGTMDHLPEMSSASKFLKANEDAVREELNNNLQLLMETHQHLASKGKIIDIEFFELQNKFQQKKQEDVSKANCTGTAPQQQAKPLRPPVVMDKRAAVKA